MREGIEEEVPIDERVLERVGEHRFRVQKRWAERGCWNLVSAFQATTCRVNIENGDSDG